MKDNLNKQGGIDFVGALQIAFIILKLLNKITWSWVWVLSPLWISILIVLIIFIVMIVLNYIE